MTTRCHHWSRFIETLCHEYPLDGAIALSITSMNFTRLFGAYAVSMTCEKGSIVVSVTLFVCYLLTLKLNLPAAPMTHIFGICMCASVCGEEETMTVHHRDIVISKH